MLMVMSRLTLDDGCTSRTWTYRTSCFFHVYGLTVRHVRWLTVNGIIWGKSLTVRHVRPFTVRHVNDIRNIYTYRVFHSFLFNKTSHLFRYDFDIDLLWWFVTKSELNDDERARAMFDKYLKGVLTSSELRNYLVVMRPKDINPNLELTGYA